MGLVLVEVFLPTVYQHAMIFKLAKFVGNACKISAILKNCWKNNKHFKYIDGPNESLTTHNFKIVILHSMILYQTEWLHHLSCHPDPPSSHSEHNPDIIWTSLDLWTLHTYFWPNVPPSLRSRWLPFCFIFLWIGHIFPMCSFIHYTALATQTLQ